MEGENSSKVLSKDLSPEKAGVGTRTAAFLGAVVAEWAVPGVFNPALDEFRGKGIRAFLHGVDVVAQIPATVATYMITKDPVLAAEVYAGMQGINLLLRGMSRDNIVDKGLDAESAAVRWPVKMLAAAVEAVGPTLLTQSSKVEKKGYKKLHKAANAMEAAGLASTAAAVLTGKPELAIAGVAAYAAGRMTMLASEVAEQNLAKLEDWERGVADKAKDKAKEAARSVKSLAMRAKGGLERTMHKIQSRRNGGGN